jgi:hypothetical protein
VPPVENYIRYHEIEKLFSLWPMLEDILKSLSLDLFILRKTKSIEISDEYIYSMCVGNKVLDDMPPTGKIGDSTGSIASNYSKIMRYDRKDTRIDISEEVVKISLIIAKLDIAFNRLNILQKQILSLYYWDEKSWEDIVSMLNVSKIKAQEERKNAIEIMVDVSLITIEAYEEVVKIVNEKFSN